MVQQNLLNAKCYLMPFSDVKPDDLQWEAIQKIGVTGILKGFGVAKGWENKMFFYPDSLVSENEVAIGLKNYFRNYKSQYQNSDSLINVSNAWNRIIEMQHYYRIKNKIPHKYPSVILNEWKSFLNKNANELATRRDVVIMFSHVAVNLFLPTIKTK